MKKTILFFAALLFTASAWAGAGFWESEAVKSLVLSVDGANQSYTWNKSGVSAVDLGKIESLSISSYEVNVWKGTNDGNICSSKMQYRVYKTSETAGDWKDIDGTWKSGDSNNQVWGTESIANKGVTPTDAGDYTLAIQFISTGSESSNSDCSSTFTLDNGGNYYTLTFTIEKSTPYVLFGSAVPTSVEVGTEVVLSATSGNFSGEVSYAYSVKAPGETAFVAIEGTSYTPSVVGTYTLKVVATADGETAEKEQTLTVKPAPIDITIRVQIPDGLTGWETTDPYLYLWNDDDINKLWVPLTSEGDNWYSYTVHTTTINFIVGNGSGWNGNARQSVDVEGVTASGCYVVGDAEGKKTVTSTTCPSTEPAVAFEGVDSAATVGDVIALAAAYRNFSAKPTLTYSVKVPGAEDFVAIEGTSYTVPKVVGTYTLKVVATADGETAEKTLEITVTANCYLAGTGIDGLGWGEKEQMPMYDNTITLPSVAANTKISFKVVFKGTWLGFSAVDTENSSEGVEGTDNIEITTSTEGDVVITYSETTEKITVTGEFGGVVAISSYTVVGEKDLLGTAKDFDETANANDMTETPEGIWTLVKKNVALEAKTYYYKVTANHAWGVKEFPSSTNNTLEIKVAGNYDVTFTLDLTGESASLSAVAKVQVESYTIVGETALLGSEWTVTDSNNDMTETDGVWTLVKENVALNVGEYKYKSVANHAWGVQEFPADGTDKTINVTDDGYYTVTFTLTPEVSLECTLTKTADAEYKYHVTYGIEGSTWAVVTLTQVGETTEWKTEEVTLPADISNYKCYVAYNNGFGDPVFVEKKSATIELSSVGGENGATGTFSIYSDSGDSNWYLKFTKKSETPTRLVEDDSAISVFADNGTIYTNDRDLRIYTLTGLEVTAQNGTLNGIYVVKTNGKIVKISVR